MRDGDPRALGPEEKAIFVTWNHSALIIELGEAMAEVGWKPWATNRDINTELFMKEMVDAFHFFMNMLIVVHSPNDRPIDIAHDFVERYYAKNKINAQRQDDGYDGKKEKCPECYRELDGDWCPVHGDTQLNKRLNHG